MNLREQINSFFGERLWGVDVQELGRRKGFIVMTLRLFYVAVKDISDRQLSLRAMSLVYTTLLSLVPLLAVSFSVLKAFGVHNQLEPLLMGAFAPLGPKGAEVTARIIEFVENMKVGVLGSLGMGMLMYTVVSLVKKIEAAINSIWKVKRPRSFARRFSDYMSVILIGPVLVFSALGLTATIMSTTVVQALMDIKVFGYAFYVAGKLVPYVLVCSAFTFIYIFIPSIKVKLRSAMVGGIFAGLLWETVGWAFASFIVSSTKYTAVYSGFAILILFMIWLYLNWLILLLGAGVSYYNQYPQFLYVRKEALMVSNRLRERLAFIIMYLVGKNHHLGRKPWTLNTLLDRLTIPMEPMLDVLDTLMAKSLIIESGSEPPGYLPAVDISVMKLGDVFDAVRTGEEEHLAIEDRYLSMHGVDRVLGSIDGAISGALGDETILDLILKNGEPEPEPGSEPIEEPEPEPEK